MFRLTNFSTIVTLSKSDKQRIHPGRRHLLSFYVIRAPVTRLTSLASIIHPYCSGAQI